MLNARQNLALGGSVALELVRDDHAGHILQPFEQFFEKLLGRLFVAPALHQNVEDMVVLIHGSPQGMALALDTQKHFIEIPCVPRSRSAVTQLIGRVLPEFATLLGEWLHK